MKKRSKKKISSEDFLGMLDAQEHASEPSAFQPKKKKTIHEYLRLSPMQKEWLNLAWSHAPQKLKIWAQSHQGQKTLSHLENAYLDVCKKLDSLRK